VSLNLRKIPFLDVVKYVAQASGLRYRVDAHAVVIEKLAPPPAPVASSDSNAKPQ
jgi:hypothetical protein